MKVFLHLLLGYSIICVSAHDYRTLLNISNKTKIRILNVKQKNEKVYVRVYLKDEDKALAFLKNSGIEYYIHTRHGIPEIFKKYRSRAGLIAGIVLFFVLIYISPMFIWEIKISGIEKISSEDAEKLLNNAGIHVGAFSPSIDRANVYSSILLGNKDVSWVSVNIIGSTAFVEFVERDYKEVAVSGAQGANIIAAKSGLITGADVRKGRRIVKDGSVVKEGEVLISGVYDSARMGTRYVYSEAKVLAIVNDKFSVDIPLNCNKKVYSNEIVQEKSLKIFGKSINILKNYNKSIEKYDTIIREERFPIFTLDRLPVSMITVCALPYKNEIITLSVENALENARKEINSLILQAEYIDILEVSESYQVINNVLHVNCNVSGVQNIASVSEFSFD